MKKLFYGFLVSLLPWSVCAQASRTVNGDSTAPAANLDSLLRYLDPTPITSGLLVDKALPLARLEGLTGTSAADDTASYAVFIRAYEMLRAAALTPTATLPGSETGFRPTAHAALADSTRALPLVALRMRYHEFKPTALTDGLLIHEGGYFRDVPGRAASPYAERTLFVAAPGADHLPWVRRGARFVLRPEHFYTNTGPLPQAVAVDLGAGTGWHPAPWNTPLTAAYATAGAKLVQVRATYPDGTVLTSRSHLTVDEAPPAQRWNTTPTATQTISGRPYLDSNGNLAPGHLTLEMAYTCDGVLRKPLIIVEGLDQYHYPATDFTYREFY